MFAVASKVTTAVAPRAASGSSSALAGRTRATPALPLAPALRSRASSPRVRTTASASNEDLMEQLMAMLGGAKGKLVAESDALPGRQEEMRVTDEHFVLGNPIRGPFPDHLETCVFATGCFWGTEKMFWRVPGVYSTSVGYVGGYTQNPTYEETCSGMTGHTEAVQVAWDPSVVSFADLLAMHWTCHDPTQGMRQGNDVGTQYRSAIYTTSDAQAKTAREMITAYEKALAQSGHRGPITTEIAPLDKVYLAEDYHQQYLAKNPGGYCGLDGTGVTCPIGIGASA